MGSGEWQTVGRKQRRAPQLLGVEQEQAKGQAQGHAERQAQGKGPGREHHTRKPQHRNGEVGHTSSSGTGATNTAGNGYNTLHGKGSTSRSGTGRAHGSGDLSRVHGDPPGGPSLLPGWGAAPGHRMDTKTRAAKNTRRGANSAHCPPLKAATRDDHSEPAPGASAEDRSRVSVTGAEQSTVGSCRGHCGKISSENALFNDAHCKESPSTVCKATNGHHRPSSSGPLGANGECGGYSSPHAQGAVGDCGGHHLAGALCANGHLEGVDHGTHGPPLGAQRKAKTTNRGGSRGAVTGEVSAILRRIQEAK